MRTYTVKKCLYFGLFMVSILYSFQGKAEDASNRSEVPSISSQPSFHSKHPHWGVEFAVSPLALGGKTLVAEQGRSPIYGVSIQSEYQPQFLGRWGVLGIGPSIAIYPISGSLTTDSIASVFAFGGQVRYQARFFRNQPIVPIIGYAGENWVYRLISGNTYANGTQTSGQPKMVFSHGPIYGLWIFLNFIEPSSAADFYVNNGVLRSYLVLEARYMMASNDQISFSGQSYYFGFRLEF